MTQIDHDPGEAERLEQLWGGAFGDDYVERNRGAYAARERFWRDLLDQAQPASVMEVGCNLGGNLGWVLAALGSGARVVGVDVNRLALAELTSRLPQVEAVHGVARRLPFADREFEMTFTMGVLIHQPEDALAEVMGELVRCSSRYVLCGEYEADDVVEVHYRGHDGALFKRPYGRLYQERHGLQVVASGFLSRDEGWDDVTWTLLEVPPPAE